jgi:hypothetical protein
LDNRTTDKGRKYRSGGRIEENDINGSQHRLRTISSDWGREIPLN